MSKSAPLIACLTAAALAMPVTAQDNDNVWNHSDIQHVLLIGIDGMHAADFLNCVNGISKVKTPRPIVQTWLRWALPA